MRIYVLGVPHTQTHPSYNTCAFTMKVWNLCRMMLARGHEVHHLGTGGSTVPCTEHHDVLPYKLWSKHFKHPGADNYDTNLTGKKEVIYHTYVRNTRNTLLGVMGEPNTEIICCPWAGLQNEATQGVPQFVVESGIGYKYTFAKYRVFESHAWLHFHLGKEGKWEGARWYDAVIPNSFDPEMFPFEKEKDDYFLFMGRLNDDKGIGIAVDVSRELGVPLKIAGQGNPDRFVNTNAHVTYLGPLGIEERKKALGKARAAFVATHYVEPFGGVAVEAQMCGTPVITTDWGAFPETVLHGVTGYRCRTRDHFVWAAKNIGNIKPADCRHWALENYSLNRVACMYEEYFQMVLNVKDIGWPLRNETRKQLSWLTRSVPATATLPVYLPEKHEAPDPINWKEAQKWEANWWGLEPGPHWVEEIKKQDTYARLMGLPADLDMGNARILDVGCGPASMLLRSAHHNSKLSEKPLRVGVDPLPMSDETKDKYRKAGVELYNSKAEDMFDGRMEGMRGLVFDEVWIYNCLQHVEDPKKILAKVKLATMTPVSKVRIFEWINLGVCPGHPHNLTEKLFLDAFPETHWNRLIWNTGVLRGFGGTVTNNYIAIHVERKYDAKSLGDDGGGRGKSGESPGEKNQAAGKDD